MSDKSGLERVALITGGAGGIGLATAELFAARGWRAIATDRRELDSLPAGVEFWSGDLARLGELESLIARLQQEPGRLDALVNNAAIQVVKPILETTPEEWTTTMQVNLTAAFELSRKAYPLLKTFQGAIVNVSSVHALATSKGIAAYAASKGGMLALTRAMALEFGADGVRVNAVLPGAVDTDMLNESIQRGHLPGGSFGEKKQAIAARTALGRIGRPADIAEAILFLADGERSSYITGQALVVDGGALAALGTE